MLKVYTGAIQSVKDRSHGNPPKVDNSILDGEGTPVRLLNPMPAESKGLAAAQWETEKERETGKVALDPNMQKRLSGGGFRTVKD